MTHKQFQKAWDKLTDAIHDRPKIKRQYPPVIIRMRELLFLAELALEKIYSGKDMDFYIIIFNKTMSFYNQQKKCLNNYF